jgi:hypothetical protein
MFFLNLIFFFLDLQIGYQLERTGINDLPGYRSLRRVLVRRGLLTGYGPESWSPGILTRVSGG